MMLERSIPISKKSVQQYFSDSLQPWPGAFNTQVQQSRVQTLYAFCSSATTPRTVGYIVLMGFICAIRSRAHSWTVGCLCFRRIKQRRETVRVSSGGSEVRRSCSQLPSVVMKPALVKISP